MKSREFKRHGIGFLVLFLLISSGCFHRTTLPLLTAYSEDERPILITHADLFTGNADEAVREGVNILIEDGRIVRISADAIDAPAAQVIPADGRMIIPGLIDSHVHINGAGAPPTLKALPNPDRNMSAFLYAGITTVVDTGGPLTDLQDMAARIERMELSGPRMVYAGKILAQAGGHPAAMIRSLVFWPFSSLIISDIMFELDADADIPEAVRENKAHGARFTKIVVDQIPLNVPSLSTQRVSEIVDAAHHEGMETVAHIGSEDDMLTCLEGGVRIFIHGPYRSTLSDETIRKMKQENCLVIPTTAVFDNLELWAQNRPHFSPLDAEIADPVILEAYRKPLPREGADPEMAAWIMDAIQYEQIKFDNVVKMKAAGISLIAGSDSINVASFPGATLHRELELLVTRCGFTPPEAVAAATYIPGKRYAGILGMQGMGYLTEGAPADLVILNGDFRRDISQTSNIHEVILKGRRILRFGPDRSEK